MVRGQLVKEVSALTRPGQVTSECEVRVAAEDLRAVFFV